MCVPNLCSCSRRNPFFYLRPAVVILDILIGQNLLNLLARVVLFVLRYNDVIKIIYMVLCGCQICIGISACCFFTQCNERREKRCVEVKKHVHCILLSVSFRITENTASSSKYYQSPKPRTVSPKSKRHQGTSSPPKHQRLLGAT